MADYTEQQLIGALRKADAAGDAAAAKAIAQRLRSMRTPKADFSDVRTGSSTSQPQPSMLDRVGRELGLGGRAMLRGGADLVGIVADPFIQGANALGANQATMRQGADHLADRLGLPTPQTAAERVSSDVTGALTSGGGLIGLGRGLAAQAPGVAQRVGTMLAAQPGTQVASAAGASASGGYARESGAGTGGQLAASLVGGLAPATLKTTGSAGLRGLMRGGEEGRKKMAQSIHDFRTIGATPSVGQATGNHRTQGIESLLAGAPTSSGVMARFATKQADDIGQGLRKVADDFSPNASAERAGRAALRGIHGEKGFVENFKQRQEHLFNKLDDFVKPDARIDISNTMRTLGVVNAPIQGAPNISRLFQNSRIKGIEGALGQDLALPTAQQTSLDEALANLDKLYSSRNSAMQDVGKFSAFANDQANRTHNWHPVAGQPRIPGRYSHFPEREAEALAAAGEAGSIASKATSKAAEIESALDGLRAAAEATKGKLPYEAIKKLRTLVGQEIQDAGLMSDFPRSKFKAIYAALSSDLGEAAKQAGPKAQMAFARANNFTRSGMSRVEDLQSVVDKAGGSEQVFNAMMSGTRDGGTTLRAVMQSLPKDGQRAVTAAVIKRMGLATPNAQDVAGETFSAGTFLTNWNRVSPEAKRALFDRHGSKFSDNMDRIARVAERIKEGSQVFANPSGTANRGLAYTYAGSLAASVLTGQAAAAGGLIGSGVLANGLARWMTNPRFVSWLARSTEVPYGAATQQVTALKSLAKLEKDEDMAALADALSQQAPNDQGQASKQRENKR